MVVSSVQGELDEAALEAELDKIIEEEAEATVVSVVEGGHDEVALEAELEKIIGEITPVDSPKAKAVLLDSLLEEFSWVLLGVIRTMLRSKIL